MCRYCGRMYFPHAVFPHELQCYKKIIQLIEYLQKEGQLSKKVKLPQPPESWLQPEEDDEEGRQMYNQQAFQFYQNCVIKCQRCQRLIPMIEIADHLCHCEADIKSSMTYSINNSNMTLSGNQNYNLKSSQNQLRTSQKQYPQNLNSSGDSNVSQQFDNRIACRRCGRKFAPNRIDQHEKICMNLTYHVTTVEEEKEQKTKQSLQNTQIQPQNLSDSQINLKHTNQQDEDKRIRCRYCQRGFSKDRIETHEEICGKLNNFQTQKSQSSQQKIRSSNTSIQSQSLNQQLNNLQTSNFKLNSSNEFQISNIKTDSQLSQSQNNQLCNQEKQYQQQSPQKQYIKNQNKKLTSNQNNVKQMQIKDEQQNPLLTQNNNQQIALFCSQCGHKFNQQDKFCCMCGTKRQ